MANFMHYVDFILNLRYINRQNGLKYYLFLTILVTEPEPLHTLQVS